MDIVTFKVAAFVVIFLTGMAGGLLSLRLAASPRSERLFSLGNALAGGIFLGAGLIHMLPDAQEGFRGAATAAGSSWPSTLAGFPWVSLICACGFLLVLFLEKVLLRHQHGTMPGASESGPRGAFYPYVLLLVLSIHSIITGIALGTEQTIALAAVILLAVMAHKGSAAFALAVSLARGGAPRGRLLRIVAFFSLMTPLGIALGWTMTALLSGATEQLAAVVFDALAAGTFLYVALLDIIQEEFASSEDRWTKFNLVGAGLGLMALLAVWT